VGYTAAAVAARAVRLAYLARPTPDVDTSTEFSSYEIEAAVVLAKRKRDRRGKVLLSEMSALVAQEGGFAGEYSGRLPGAQVLARPRSLQGSNHPRWMVSRIFAFIARQAFFFGVIKM
jgi:hypothetical protein